MQSRPPSGTTGTSGPGTRRVWSCLALVSLASLVSVAAPPIYVSPERVDPLVLTAMELDRDAKRGAVLYRDHCAGCHGPQALGSAARVIPALAGQRQAYLIKQLADFTELERDSRDMHQVIAREACMECGACARNCPEGAITVRAGVGCAQGILSSALGIDTCCSVKTPQMNTDTHRYRNKTIRTVMKDDDLNIFNPITEKVIGCAYTVSDYLWFQSSKV